MMATRVEKTATLATPRGERKREAQTTQQQEAKRLGIEPRFFDGWETSERLPAHGAALRKHQSSLSLVEHWPHLGRALTLESGGGWALPTNSWSWAVIFQIWVLRVSTFSWHVKPFCTDYPLALHHTANGL